MAARKKADGTKPVLQKGKTWYVAACSDLFDATTKTKYYSGRTLFDSEAAAIKNAVENADSDQTEFYIYEVRAIAKHARPKETVRTPL